jgi:hypothetical protein
LIFQSYITQIAPPSVIVIVTLALAALSQYAGNSRVKDAVEEVKKWKWVHYGLTILMALVPILMTYQSSILDVVPTSLVVPATLLLAFLSQFVSGIRSNNAVIVNEEPPIDPQQPPEPVAQPVDEPVVQAPVDEPADPDEDGEPDVA